jgi:hypothetical protein
MTLETQSAIKSAEKVLVVAPNPLSIQHIRQLNAKAENLGRFYEGDVTRLETYHLMANHMVMLVEQGFKVCTIFYGHPGIFVLSTHMAYDKLIALGHEVKMLPGISADACLFADLNIDPASTGCQSFEATQFLLTERNIDNGAALIIWQIGLVGEHTLKKQAPGELGLKAITKLLSQTYPSDHKVCLYQAPTLPGFAPQIDWLKLEDLPLANVPTTTTLFIPACREIVFAKDRLQWLGLTEQDLSAWDEPTEEVMAV